MNPLYGSPAMTAEQRVAALARHVVLEGVLDSGAGIQLLEVHAIDGQNLPRPDPAHGLGAELGLEHAQLVSVAHGEFGLESGAPVHAVHDAPDGPVALALGHVVAHAEVEDLSAGEEPKACGERFQNILD